MIWDRWLKLHKKIEKEKEMQERIAAKLSWTRLRIIINLCLFPCHQKASWRALDSLSSHVPFFHTWSRAQQKPLTSPQAPFVSSMEELHPLLPPIHGKSSCDLRPIFLPREAFKQTASRLAGAVASLLDLPPSPLVTKARKLPLGSLFSLSLHSLALYLKILFPAFF